MYRTMGAGNAHLKLKISKRAQQTLEVVAFGQRILSGFAQVKRSGVSSYPYP